MQEVYYFSAFAYHMMGANPDHIAHHQSYIDGLSASGAKAHIGRFKDKDVKCVHCGVTTTRHEEKETDVAIAVQLLALAFDRTADVGILVTGDTDLAPAIRTVRAVGAPLKIGCAFPYKRKNKELAKLADFSFNMSKEAYASHQFPDPIVLADGRQISKPLGW